MLVLLFGGVSDDDTVVEFASADDDAVEAVVVLGIVGLLLVLVELEVSGFIDELATDCPGAVPTFGAGIFWQLGGSYASAKIRGQN